MKTIAVEYTVHTVQDGDLGPMRTVLPISDLKYGVLMEQHHPLYATVIGDIESILRPMCNLQGGTLDEWNYTSCM